MDPRYSLANERTFLAWIRTALGLLVAAAAVVAVDLPWPTAVVRAVAIVLAAMAALAALLGWDRWRKVEAAIAERRAAPTPRAHVLLTLAVALVAGVLIVLVLL